MADIVERIIAPYNPPDQRVIQKTEYTMFVPIGTNVNPGMLGYDTTAFTTKDGILYLSNAYSAKIERAISIGDWLPEEVRALELSLSMAIGQKLAATPSAAQVSVTDKYLFIAEVGVLISAYPVGNTYSFKYENGSWYLTYNAVDYELDSLASIGLSVTGSYTSTFTVAVSYAPVQYGDTGYHNNALYHSDQAANQAANAAGSATNAANKALVSEGHATGEQNGVPVDSESPYYHKNSKYYSEQAAGANSNAQNAVQDARAEALKSEGYARGTQQGADVQPGSSYYHKNAYYYLKEAGRAVNDAKDYADSASGYATDAQNSAFYAELNKQSASAASTEAKEARDQARQARDDVLGALGAGVDVQPNPNTVPKRDANGKLYAAEPSAADGNNVVATKGFVNSSVSTNTANFLGTYTYTGTDDHNAIAAWIPSQLPAGTIVTNQDYVFVQMTTTEGNTKYERYKYNSNNSAWGYEYELNNSSFTAAQWAAINSGITAGDIAAVQAAIAGIEETLGQHQDDLDGLAQDINTLESTKQNVIDATHKLSSDLVDDTDSQTHKFVTPTEKATWNGKQAALTAGRNISLAGNIADFSIPFVVLSSSAGDTIDVANGTVVLSANHSAVFANNDFVRVQCNDLFGNNGDTYVFQRTYNEPTSNNEKIEYFVNIDVGFYGQTGVKAHQYTFFYTTGTTPITLEFVDQTTDGGGASYTAGDGIDITNNVISVDLDYYTAEEIDALWYGSYTITASVTNGTGTSGSITGKPTATATITITPSEGYTLPATVTVTNATLSAYDDTTGVVTVTAATGNVTVTAVCESAALGGTDLTGTTWTINSTTCTAGYGQFNINYIDNVQYIGTNFYGLLLGYEFSPKTGYTSADNSAIMTLSGQVFANNLSIGDSLTFTGGTDVTNATLISWLQANATLISW